MDQVGRNNPPAFNFEMERQAKGYGIQKDGRD